MNIDNKERQRIFKEKMYRAGFKQVALWVKDKPDKKISSIKLFLEKAEKILQKLNTDEQRRMFALIIKILEGRKEALKLKERKKSNMPEENE